MRASRCIRLISLIALLVAVTNPAMSAADLSGVPAVRELPGIGDVAVPRAECGPGSRPETGLQGDVPALDRDTLRSMGGYTCNMSLVGQYAGRGAAAVSAAHDHCAYVGSFFLGNTLAEGKGVQVLDLSDPAHPRPTADLTEPAMIAGTWESLKVHPGRKLLVGTGVPFLWGAGLLSVYDLSDCAHPRLLNPGAGTNLALPLPMMTHEGGFSPDGLTYWVSGLAPGQLTAVDLADPANPRIVWQGITGVEQHGMGFSRDGDRMYIAALSGFSILDIGSVRRRDATPVVRDISRTYWTDGFLTQHTIPVTYHGVRHLFVTDEAGSGGVKLFDIAEETAPELVARIKLEINLPENIDRHVQSALGGAGMSYDPHYCAVDRPDDPTALACGWISSGIRVFDIRDPENFREIAYFNPPARTGQLLELWNSLHAWSSFVGIPVTALPAALREAMAGRFDPAQAATPRAGLLTTADMSSDWCLSPPEWRGSQLWVSCSDNGYLVLSLDNGSYVPPPNQLSTFW
ncbi:LVIVD repeat-containing protein [Nocardia sp. NPDC127579]|uniref:LVIVD repeat-containing protein n=1 Tax=Nocardia sp. NPDC127579 TaxID=3345402 RepID=UPI003625620C